MLFEQQVENLYRKELFSRCDDTGAVFYYSAKDFQGLKQESYRFASHAGHMLQGYFYHYENPVNGRLIVFDHGLGGGHRAYMKEIELLARQGYLVFAYDHTGCMESEGASTNGFAQSVNDLDACLQALRHDARCAECSISLVGHSWGAYAVLNVAAFHPYVRHIVAMSGYLSVKRMVAQTFAGFLKGYQKHILAVEYAANPTYFACDAIKALQKTNAHLLVIHSSDDKVVSAKRQFAVLRNALANRPNSRFVLYKGKGHSPNYTVDAVTYKDAFFRDFTRAMKKGTLTTPEQKQAFMRSYDWDRMTQQDGNVWQDIFSMLEK